MDFHDLYIIYKNVVYYMFRPHLFSRYLI